MISLGGTWVFLIYVCALFKVEADSSIKFVEIMAWTAKAVSHNWLPLYPCKRDDNQLLEVNKEIKIFTKTKNKDLIETQEPASEYKWYHTLESKTTY